MDNLDLIRELSKIQGVLEKVQAHLYHKDAMNANLHMSETVNSTPLYSAVTTALQSMKSVGGRLLLEIDDENEQEGDI